MKFNMPIIFSAVVVLSLSLLGCAGATKGPQQTKEFRFDRSWARHTFDKEYLGYKLNHIMAPILYKKLVVQGNEVDGLVAYDKKSGRQKWRINIDGGVTSDAKLHKDILYFGAGDGFFYAVDLSTGTKRWTFPIRAEGLGAPLVEDGVVYFLAGNNVAYALKAENGEQVWLYNRPDPANLTVRGASEPTIVENQIFFGFSDGHLVALDKNTGALKWERLLGEGARFRDVDSKPVYSDGRLFVSSYDGRLYSLSIVDGKEFWRHDEGGFLPVAIEGATLFYPTSNKKLLALEKNSGKLIWEKSNLQSVISTPVFFRGLVIFSEWSGSVRALDAQTGEDVASFHTGRGVTSKPTLDVDNNRLYVMSADANLFSLHMRWRRAAGVWVWENL